MADTPNFDLEAKTDNARAGALKALNEYLSTRSFMEGYSKSQLDAQTFLRINVNSLDATKYGHVARWAAHIGFFSAAQRATWRELPKPKAAEPEEAEEEEETGKAKKDSDDEDEDDANPFGAGGDDSDEEESEALKKNKEVTEKVQARQAAKKGDAKSNVTLDVKPEEAETDMDDLKARVIAIEMDGLKWLGGQFIPVAYGIRKLRIMCQITDEKISSPDIIVEEVEALEGCQSCDIFAFQMA